MNIERTEGPPLPDEAVVPPWTCHDGAGQWYRIIDPEHVRLRGAVLQSGEHRAIAQAITDSEGVVARVSPIPALDSLDEGDVIKLAGVRHVVHHVTRDRDDAGAWVTLRLGPPLPD